MHDTGHEGHYKQLLQTEMLLEDIFRSKTYIKQKTLMFKMHYLQCENQELVDPRLKSRVLISIEGLSEPGENFFKQYISL